MTDGFTGLAQRAVKRGKFLARENGHNSGLYVTDEELIDRLGVPEKIAREALQVLDHDARSGFPKKLKLWGDRRYWPAVREYLDSRYCSRRTADAT
jgi:hypothetical protein